MNLIMLLGGGVLLYFGAEWLVGGASGLARALGVPQLLIGLTVVAYGTSAPEVVVGVKASLAGLRGHRAGQRGRAATSPTSASFSGSPPCSARPRVDGALSPPRGAGAAARDARGAGGVARRRGVAPRGRGRCCWRPWATACGWCVATRRSMKAEAADARARRGADGEGRGSRGRAQRRAARGRLAVTALAGLAFLVLGRQPLRGRGLGARAHLGDVGADHRVDHRRGGHLAARAGHQPHRRVARPLGSLGRQRGGLEHLQRALCLGAARCSRPCRPRWPRCGWTSS